MLAELAPPDTKEMISNAAALVHARRRVPGLRDARGDTKTGGHANLPGGKRSLDQ